jgi:hypothetical protein
MHYILTRAPIPLLFSISPSLLLTRLSLSLTHTHTLLSLSLSLSLCNVISIKRALAVAKLCHAETYHPARHMYSLNVRNDYHLDILKPYETNICFAARLESVKKYPLLGTRR